MRRRLLAFCLFALSIGALGVSLLTPSEHKPEAPRPEPASAPWVADSTDQVERNGAVVEFSIGRRGEAAQERHPLMEGDTAEVYFRVTDAASGLPMRGLSPAAWMDMGRMVTGEEARQTCKDRVSLYLKGLVGIRPLIDMNSYYLLVMNQDPSISVIDPLVGMTGKTSLYTTIVLPRPGADWVRSADARRLYVSMPKAGKVAVVDTETFKVVAQVAAGPEPLRVALQPDGRYLWVGNDTPEAGTSGVTVVDTESLRPAGRIVTGRGHHEIAFSSDDRHAFVSNRDEGTVSVIDIARLEKVKDLRTGPLPISLAYSALSQVLYVVDGREGRIAAVDGARLEEVARMEARSGLGPLRFTQDGRWGLVVNPVEHAVYVVDAAENRLVHTLALDGQPYQVAFTRAFAYVRLLDSERVAMVNLSSLGEGKKPVVQGFAAGTVAPKLAGELSVADSVTQASTEAAVFVASPAENTTYFYMEGMNAPMGSFINYGHNARAVAVVDRSLREVEPGLYGARVRLPAAGRYDVAFLLDSPQVLHCFHMDVKENPALQPASGPLEITWLELPPKVQAGSAARLRFRLGLSKTHQPAVGLKDVKVLTYMAPGRLRTEVSAREVEDGVYEAEPTLASAGAWYLYVSVPSMQVRYGGLPYRTLWVVDGAQGGPAPKALETEEENRHATQVR